MLVGVESPEFENEERNFGCTHRNYRCKSLALVLGDEAPRASVAVLIGALEPVEIAEVGEIIILVVFVNLLFYLPALLCAQLIRVKLVAERAPERDVALYFVIRPVAGRDMRAH